MNVGLTIDISFSTKNSTKNQAIILIADVLVRAGHKCFLITNKRFNPYKKNAGFDILNSGHFLARFDMHEASPIPLDICIEAGFQYEPDVARELRLKNPKCTFIYFCFEDQHAVDSLSSTTNIQYGTKRAVRQFDEAWTWEHLQRSTPYIEATYKCASRTIPFLWDPKFILQETKKIEKKRGSAFYNKKSKNIVCILEDNKNAFSTCLIPLAICETLDYRSPDLICKVNITNSESLKKNEHFKKLVSNLSICEQKKEKVYFNNKWANVHALSRWGKCVISNETFGDLNAKHLEFIYLKFPFLHNISAIKDFAYYYSTENIGNAVNQLEYALTMHDQNIDYYNGQMKECLCKFSTTNSKNISAYQSIIQE